MTDPLARLRRFFSELKRRNVYRVAVTYVVVAFVGLQAVDLLIPATTLPAWADEFLVALAVFGFPVALVLAWAFEMTPEGVRRTPVQEAEASEPSGMGAAALSVAVFALLVAGGVGWWAITRSGGGGGEQQAAARDTATLPPAEGGRDRASVAVLPLDDLSPEGEKGGNLGVGFTEAIIAELAALEELSVVSRTSVMPFQETDLSVPEIADTLGVGHVLEGSVTLSPASDEIKIVAQLIDGETDRHVWARTFNRSYSDLFQIQSEVALRVAEALEAELSPEDRARIEQAPTTSPAAYELYLRARDLTKAGPADNRTAIELYGQAIGMDSAFALAYAGLAQAYEERGDFGLPGRWSDSSRSAARTALGIDSTVAEAYEVLGETYWEAGQLEIGTRQFRRALTLKPGLGEALYNLGAASSWRGENAEALRLSWRLLAKEPQDWAPRRNMAVQLHAFQEDSAAEAWQDRAVALGSPGGYRLWMDVGRGRIAEARKHWMDFRSRGDPDGIGQWQGVLAQLEGQTGRARAHYRAVYEDFPKSGLFMIPVRVRLAQTMLATGARDSARRLLRAERRESRQAIQKGSETGNHRLQMAATELLLGRRDEAYRWLDSVVVTGLPPNYRFIRHSPLWEQARGEEPFEEFLDRLEMDAMRQREKARTWAATRGIDWPPLPEDSPVTGG